MNQLEMVYSTMETTLMEMEEWQLQYRGKHNLKKMERGPYFTCINSYNPKLLLLLLLLL